MNRAEARKYQKQGGMDANAVRREIAKETARLRAEFDTKLKKDIGAVVNDYSAALLICLHDKLGFGRTRAQRFALEVEELFDNIRLGLVSIEEIKEAVREELDIVID